MRVKAGHVLTNLILTTNLPLKMRQWRWERSSTFSGVMEPIKAEPALGLGVSACRAHVPTPGSPASGVQGQTTGVSQAKTRALSLLLNAV